MRGADGRCGTLLGLADGTMGYASFNSISSPGAANPPWQWRGGGACNNTVGGAYCWYNFGVDGTGSWNDPAYWPVSSNSGMLLLYPHSEFNSRIAGLPGTDAPYRYNPYLQSPPNYYGPQPLFGSIGGPNTVGQGSVGTWTAVPTYGTAPYTYQWSGKFTGNGQSVSGTVDQSGDLFLDIFDAVGQQVSVSIYINYTGCPGSEITC